MTPDAATIASHLTKAKRQGAGWIACCPAHEDSTPSLSINDGQKGPVFKCHAGCSQESVLNAIEALGVTIRKKNGHVHDEPQETLTLGAFAAAKQLPEAHLSTNYVADIGAGISFNYVDALGQSRGIKNRKYLSGNRQFWWSQGHSPALYGMWRLERMLANDQRIFLCEGESDTLTLWHHEYTALGVSGTNGLPPDWELTFTEKFYVVLDNDKAGAAFRNVVAASKVKHLAWFISMPDGIKDINQLHAQDPAKFVERFDALIANAEPAEVPKPPAIVLRHIADIIAERREPNWLIHKTLEANVLAVIAGSRGTFKSFIAMHWLMMAAVEGHQIVMLTAEGGGLDRRVDAWMRTFAPAIDSRTLPIAALERALNLNSAEVMADLQAAIDASGNAPKAILIDTFSKYSPGIDENDNGEVALFLGKLSSSLREKYGCTVVLVAHAGHGDAKRPRGASALMANPDAEYIVDRPDLNGMAVSVSRDRFKDSPSLPALTYMAESVDLGRIDRYGDPVTSLIVRSSDHTLIRKPPTGKAQRALLAELERLVATKTDGIGVWPQEALREIARTLGFHKNTSRDAVLGLVEMRFLVPTVGGYRLGK